MEELHLLAQKYYSTAPQNIKEHANKFFREIDINKDGKVKFDEFLAFLRNGGYFRMCNPHFFGDLKNTGRDYIGFWEVMTLYYILVSRRPFCDGCGTFIKGTFFTCVTCFESNHKSFNICINCFHHESYIHEHDRSQYLDNFLLLERSRAIAECQRKEFQHQAINSQNAAGTSYQQVTYPNYLWAYEQQAINSQYSAGTSYQQVTYPNYLWEFQHQAINSQYSTGTSYQQVHNPNYPLASQQPMSPQPSAGTSSQVVAYNPTNIWTRVGAYAGIVGAYAGVVSAVVTIATSCSIM